MPINQAKVEELAAALKEKNGGKDVTAIDPHRGLYEDRRWYTHAQIRSIARGGYSEGYDIDEHGPGIVTGDYSMSNPTLIYVKSVGADTFQRMARAAGLNCEIISANLRGDARTQAEFGTWHLHFHGEETLRALAAAGMGCAALALGGSQGERVGTVDEVMEQVAAAAARQKDDPVTTGHTMLHDKVITEGITDEAGIAAFTNLAALVEGAYHNRFGAAPEFTAKDFAERPELMQITVADQSHDVVAETFRRAITPVYVGDGELISGVPDEVLVNARVQMAYPGRSGDAEPMGIADYARQVGLKVLEQYKGKDGFEAADQRITAVVAVLEEAVREASAKLGKGAPGHASDGPVSTDPAMPNEKRL